MRHEEPSIANVLGILRWLLAGFLNIRGRRILFVAVTLLGCTAAEVPEIYHGRAGQTVLAVPSRIASSVLYDGESDWVPPERPRAKRTDRDPIQAINFWVDLEQPNKITPDAVARDWLLNRGGAMNLPALNGQIIGISVGFPKSKLPYAATVRSRVSEGVGWPLKPAPFEHGLETRRADWSQPVEGRTRHGNGIFEVDVDYLSNADNVYIYCNDARQVVAPFAPMATCQFTIVVPELGATMSGSFDRGDVSRWRDLRAAALATLQSFVVSPR